MVGVRFVSSRGRSGSYKDSSTGRGLSNFWLSHCGGLAGGCIPPDGNLVTYVGMETSGLGAIVSGALGITGKYFLRNFLFLKVMHPESSTRTTY
ncbi:hypothetical protein PoB_005144700 [Plakobranchus ocellatus]|uniref:Uncharacterized protein n=1 Tax=Plakobranchus ocellatus TaxID=259542 RepID=A0AAV4C034_9GAST|nr:hypothetical protein PoB_005144700 [Plakobranchus ocellatus]